MEFKQTGRFLSPVILLMIASQVLAQPDPGYYDSVDTSSSQSLRGSLHEIIDDHTRFPYTSSETDTWDVLEIADEDRQNPSNIVTIYRNASFLKRGGGNDFYNREHTWPRSYGFPDNGPQMNYPFTDMHHLFLADSDYNYYRSNMPYDNCDASCWEYKTLSNDGRGGAGGGYPGDSNWATGEFTDGKWETWSGRKGDVARAMMYMDVRYEGGMHGITGATEPDLVLTDDRDLIDQSNTGDNEAVAYMGILSVLLEWHEADPVDDIEMQHHEAVASFQGNRNPFIDHPEWAACVYLENCPVFTLNAGLNDAWYNPETTGQGFFITVFPDFNIVNMAWFTYDIELPSEGAQANLGDAGHRWLTATGPIVDNSAVMDITVTSGGLFDTPTKVERTDPPGSDGRIILTFENCRSGTVEYDIPSINRQGTIPIERVANDNIVLCEALSATE